MACSGKTYSNFVIVLAFVFLSALLIPSISAPVDDSNATETKLSANVSYEIYTLTLSTTPSLSLSISADPTGVMSVGTTTVTTNTTSPNGYKLYLGMNSTSNDLIHSTNDALRITPVSGTFTNTSALTNNSTWGYAIRGNTATAPASNDFDNTYTTGTSFAPNDNKFAAVPTSSNPPQLIASSNSASASGGDSLDVYYGIRASYATATGTYSNQVRYTAISDGGAGHKMYVSPEQTANTAGGEPMTITTTLYATSPTTAINSNVASNTTTTGDIEANAYLLTPAELANVHNNTPVSAYSDKKLACARDTSALTLTLNCTTPAASIGNYYVYVDVPSYNESYEKAFSYVAPTSFFTLATMQQMSDYPQFCASATTPSADARYEDIDGSFAGNTNYVPTVILRDTRDGNRYTVRKLADGKCWMTENLKISGKTLTPADSNVLANYNLPASSTDGWCATNDSTCINTANVLNASDQASGGDPTHPEYGTFYSWDAATAGTGTYSTASGDTSSSICPKGWRLPTGNNAGDLQGLYSKYSSASAMLSTGGTIGPQFVLSGGRNGSSTYNQGSRAGYWSSTAYSNSHVYGLGIGTDSANPSDYLLKSRGFAVRCVASDFWTMQTMQEMSPGMCDMLQTPNSNATLSDTDGTHRNDPAYIPEATLIDVRDSVFTENNTQVTKQVSYTVRKLADGNCWMTDNLALNWSSSRTFTPADTNVNSSKTVTVATQSLDGTRPAAGSTEANAWMNASAASADTWLSRSTNNATDSGGRKYGTYYNWYTATLGSLPSDTTESYPIDASEDICPAGWQIPRYTGSGSYLYLFREGYHIIANDQTSITGTNIGTQTKEYPFTITMAGVVLRTTGESTREDTNGYYWNSEANSIDRVGVMNNNANSIYPDKDDNKRHGFSLRCYAKPTL